MPNMNYEQLKEEVKKSESELIKIRRHLHAHPELSKKEYETATFIENYLNEIGIKTKRVKETGVYGILSCKKETTLSILLRADIDALPIEETTSLSFQSLNENVMHACGHDVHTASLLVALKILANHVDELNANVEFFFQQAEEIGYGARAFIDSGFLNTATTAFGLHIASRMHVGDISFTKGPANASVDYFKIETFGISSHIATPEEGVDALYYLNKIYLKIKEFEASLKEDNNKIIIGIGKMRAGTTYNIVADHASIEGTVRTFDKTLRSKIKNQIYQIASSACADSACKTEITWIDYASPLINEEIPTSYGEKIAIALFGEEHVKNALPPSLSGDDFAEYINHVGGCYAYIGTHNDEDLRTKLPHHNPNLVIDEASLSIACQIYVAYALGYTENFKNR